jgi:hypothetical protein
VTGRHPPQRKVGGCQPFEPFAPVPQNVNVVRGIGNARNDSIESQTVRLTMIMSSSKARMAVASPSGVVSRQMKPGLLSPSRLIGSSRATNSAISGESSGASSRPTLSWASSKD